MTDEMGDEPAALDVVDAEPVQREGDAALLVDAEVDALGLRPVVS